MKEIVKEEWKTLTYNDYVYERYEVSNLGRIRSVGRWVERTNRWGTVYSQWYQSRIMKLRTNHIEKHLFTDCLDSNSKQHSIYVHKAVFETFGGRKKDYVSHKNGIVTENYFGNLYAVTHSQLQVRNMHNNPEARWRLSTHNHKSGYYKSITTISKTSIKEIKRLHKDGISAFGISIMVEVSESSVYKYREDEYIPKK